MTRKIMTLLLILFVAVTLQSQKPKKDVNPDTTSLGKTILRQDTLIRTMKFDSSVFYASKLDSVNTDIDNAVIRINRKIEQIPKLVDRVVLTIEHNNRPISKVEMIENLPPVIVLPELKTDTTSTEKQASRRKVLWLFNRD